MLLAVFGLPGGAEWLIILGVVLVLFVPVLASFGLGYLAGRKSTTSPAAAPPKQIEPTVVPEPETPADGDVDA